MKLWRVASWEFVEKIKSKAFLISLVLLPVIMVGFGILPGILASKADERTVEIGIVDNTGVLFQPLKAKLDKKYRLPDGEPNYELKDLTPMAGPEDSREALNELVSDGQIEGYFYFPRTTIDSGNVEYRARNVGNIRVLERFSRTLEEVITEKQLTAAGVRPELLAHLRTNVDVKSIKLTGEGEEKESGFLETFFGAYIFIMMLMFMVLTSGQLMIRSVVEEKSNRLMEVLLSSCSARDLMVGKILGLSGLGFFQLLVWGAIAAGISLQLNAHLISLDNLWLQAIYFILGYLLYAAIFVAAGAPVTTEQEAQQITSYVSLTLVFPIVLAVPAMQNPDSLLIKILTFIPVMTPAFMLLRIPIQMPPTWEIFASIAILAVSVLVAMWAAGKIFRTAILAYGKRLTIAELVRLLRVRT